MRPALRQILFFVLLAPSGIAGETDLAYYPPSIRHTHSCAYDGVWNGSCDIEKNMPTVDAASAPTIYTLADWSESCDPWKGVTETKTLTYNSSQGVWVNLAGAVKTAWTTSASNWECPQQYRSMSGCGDFRTDTRNLSCASKKNLFNCGRPLNADRRTYNAGEIFSMSVPQRHVCIQHPIFYDNLNTEPPVVPPAMGRHRERWAKWGKYDYLPPQRWMHNNEHGSVLFLYHQCLDEESLCALRRYIQKWQARIGKIPWKGSNGDNDDEFRFLLTPFKDLATPISIVMWGQVYSSKCFNEHDMDYFIEKHYRNGFEDWPPDGAYNYLWKDISQTASSCGPLPAAGTVAASYMLSARDEELAQLRELVTALTTEVNSLKSQMANIKGKCKTNSGGRRLQSDEPCEDGNGIANTGSLGQAYSAVSSLGLAGAAAFCAFDSA